MLVELVPVLLVGEACEGLNMSDVLGGFHAPLRLALHELLEPGDVRVRQPQGSLPLVVTGGDLRGVLHGLEVR